MKAKPNIKDAKIALLNIINPFTFESFQLEKNTPNQAAYYKTNDMKYWLKKIYYGFFCQSDPDTFTKFNYIGFTHSLRVSALRAQFHWSQGKALYWLLRAWLRLLVNSFKSSSLLPKMQLSAYPADICRKGEEAEGNYFMWYDRPNNNVALWKRKDTFTDNSIKILHPKEV